jgi:hypothetical protein
LNKSTKIRLNYLIGFALSALLLWGIYLQVTRQLANVDASTWWQTGPVFYLWLCIALMLVNVALEARKWQILAGSAEALSYRQSLSSYLAGIAISIVTPNRLGEYPGRILYLKRQNTFRLISVSVLGSFAQLLTIFIYGSAALIYYNVHNPGVWSGVLLAGSLAMTVILAWCFWRFEAWLPLLGRIKWLEKYKIYGQLLMRFSAKEQLTILGISLLRFAVFTAQYLVLLRWMNVIVPPVEGFLLSALFFWVIAVVPSIALAELGIRGQVGLFLFQPYSNNTIGILSATIGIWLINLIVPAILGSLLLLRMKVFRLRDNKKS